MHVKNVFLKYVFVLYDVIRI